VALLAIVVLYGRSRLAEKRRVAAADACWIDADACPRAARTGGEVRPQAPVRVVLVAGQPQIKPGRSWKLIVVPAARMRPMITWWSTPCPGSW
jgi:hypothetical protein